MGRNGYSVEIPLAREGTAASAGSLLTRLLASPLFRSKGTDSPHSIRP